MSIIFRMRGDAEVGAYLQHYPDALAMALRQKFADLAVTVSQFIKNDELSGQLLKVKSGELRNSIYARMYYSKGAVTLSFGSRGNVPYAEALEDGGRTPPHYIRPNKAAVLSFISGGAQRFAMVVRHPGAPVRGVGYLRAALDAKMDSFVSAVEEAAAQAKIP